MMLPPFMCYGLSTMRPPATSMLPILLLCILIGLIAGCGDDGGGPVESCSAGGQGLFAPCGTDEHCAADRLCFAGMCSPRCLTGPDDCTMQWDGASILGQCVTSDSQQSVCGYSCDILGVKDCPVAADPMVCEQQFVNPIRKFCSAEQRCDE
jgi:hypothetical protein